MSCFFSNRTISVPVDEVLSQRFSVNVGVPQVSILVPNLLILFMNNLITSITGPLQCSANGATIVLFLARVLIKLPPISTMIILFLMRRLSPISDESLLGVLQTVPV